MDTEKMTRAMARWWQTMNEKDSDPQAANPMLYDPLGEVKTKRVNQYLATCIVCLCAVSAGTALSWTSPALSALLDKNSTLPITPSEGTWISSLLGIGAIVGAIPSGIIAELIGRKYTCVAVGIPFIISWGLIAFASNVTMLYFGRFLIGAATGGSCVIAPMFVSEYAEAKIRGQLGTCFQLFLTIGILICYVLGELVAWDTLSKVCGIIPIVFVCLVFLLPESPVYLLKKGRTQDATLSIKWFWGQECDSRAAIQMIQKDLENSGGNAGLRELLSVRANRVGFIMSIMLMVFQQLSGINAVIFYTKQIFTDAGSTLKPGVCSIIVGIVQVLMTFASAVLIEKAGRKVLLIFSSLAMGLCLSGLGIYFSMKLSGKDVTDITWLPLASVVIFIVAFSLGYGPIPWMMMGELLPTEVKGIATSLVVLFNWILVFGVTKFFEPLTTSLGQHVVFFGFAVIMLIGTIYGFKFVFETKGKSAAEIQMILSGDTSPN